MITLIIGCVLLTVLFASYHWNDRLPMWAKWLRLFGCGIGGALIGAGIVQVVMS
jgi:hypothetical protein